MLRLSVLRRVLAALLFSAACSARAYAESASPQVDATLPSLTSSTCVDNSECLSDQWCLAGACVACGTPADRCSTTEECGPGCLGVRCIEGRCVRAADPRADLDAGSVDAAFDGGALRLSTPMPREPGCGGARVAPAHEGDHRSAVIAALSALGVMITSEARRRRGAR